MASGCCLNKVVFLCPRCRSIEARFPVTCRRKWQGRGRDMKTSGLQRCQSNFQSVTVFLPFFLYSFHTKHRFRSALLLLPGSFSRLWRLLKQTNCFFFSSPGKNCSTVSPHRFFFSPQALNGENNFILDEGQYPPLNLGDPETGLLTEANLLYISRRIGLEWEEIGLRLGLLYEEVQRIKFNNRSVSGFFFFKF